jgi:hypothetical protein
LRLSDHLVTVATTCGFIPFSHNLRFTG